MEFAWHGSPCNSLVKNESLIKHKAMKTLLTVIVLSVFSVLAHAADVTGTWKAEFNTQRGLQKYTFN